MSWRETGVHIAVGSKGRHFETHPAPYLSRHLRVGFALNETSGLRVPGTCLASKIQNALWQAYHKLDWAAFNNLLVQPRR